MLAVRADRKPWLVVLRLDDYLRERGSSSPPVRETRGAYGSSEEEIVEPRAT